MWAHGPYLGYDVVSFGAASDLRGRGGNSLEELVDRIVLQHLLAYPLTVIVVEGDDEIGEEVHIHFREKGKLIVSSIDPDDPRVAALVILKGEDLTVSKIGINYYSRLSAVLVEDVFEYRLEVGSLDTIVVDKLCRRTCSIA